LTSVIVISTLGGSRFFGEDKPKTLLAPYPLEGMTRWPVSPRVNSVKDNEPSLIEPITFAG
jgi:putative SOS response-associated peptidase YedK